MSNQTKAGIAATIFTLVFVLVVLAIGVIISLGFTIETKEDISFAVELFARGMYGVIILGWIYGVICIGKFARHAYDIGIKHLGERSESTT